MRAAARILLLIALLTAAFVTQPILAGGHTWRIKEVFSNADGTVQYIEAWESLGGDGETATAGHDITSNTNSFTIPANVAAPTGFRSLLFATQGFADLGVVTPDYIIADNFFSTTADTITYTPFPPLTFVAGQLPTDGIHALDFNLSVVVNSPENYAGDGGTVDVSVKPPAVPGMTVAKPVPGGSEVTLAFDTATCDGNGDHQVVWGVRAGLPAALGGTYTPSGAACLIGGSPFDWTSVPDPLVEDPVGRMIWWLVLATNGTDVEGSWSADGGGGERSGPGTNGSSAQCGISNKDLTNTCGQ